MHFLRVCNLWSRTKCFRAAFSRSANADDDEIEEDLDEVVDEDEEDEEPQPAAAADAAEKLVDLHVCGACEAVFSDVDIFVEHKRTGCAPRKQTPRRLLPHKPPPAAKAAIDNKHSKPLEPHSDAPFDFAPRPSDTPLAPLGIITDAFVAET